MASFGAQLQAFADKTGEKLENVDRAFKIGLFDRVVSNTRVDTGRLRGNWQVTTDTPAVGELDRLQPAGGLSPAEAAKVQPFSLTILSNNLPYAMHWEEQDAMIGRAVADAMRQLEKAVREA